MDEITEKGGANIGMGRVSSPFAKLIVTRYYLEIDASIWGKLIFRRSDIVSIELSTGLLNNGITINHTVEKYRRKVTFIPQSNATALLGRIKQNSFFANTTPIPANLEQQITARQTAGSFPFRLPALIVIILVWNALFIYDQRDFFTIGIKVLPAGIGERLAFGFMFVTCLLTLTFEPVRRLILKDGVQIKDVNKPLYFLMAIAGTMFLVTFLFSHLSPAR